MKSLPQRLSLASETVRVLRERILAGEWGDALPGERELCARLHVSRPTLRAALDALRQSGWLAGSQQGKRRRIQVPGRGALPVVPPTNRAVLISPIPLHRLAPFALFWLDDVRQRLSEEGFELEVHVSHATNLRRPEQLLERLTCETRAAAWILFASSAAMQRWFSARGLPCLVTGSCFADITLPSVDVDHQATCRHAAGLLAARGHRRIALLAPDSGTAGELASETGFLEGSRRASGNVEAWVVRHNQTVEDVCRQVDRITSPQHRATAILAARSENALTILTHLQRTGHQLPRDVALIARDDDSFLDFVVPSVARYTCPPATFARHVSRIVLQLAKHGSAPARQALLMPEFLKGETLGG